MKKIFFSQSSSSEKISLKNMIQDNNLESILGGMSENLCQEDLSESSDSTKTESKKTTASTTEELFQLTPQNSNFN